AGLDPKARIEFKHLVRLLAGEGKTIFISSHILSELGEMCDTLLFIDQGKIVHHGSAETLLRGGGDARATVDVVVDGDPAGLLEWVAMNPGVELAEARRDGAQIVFDPGTPEALAEGLRRMVSSGIRVTDFHRGARRLEEAFVDI